MSTSSDPQLQLLASYEQQLTHRFNSMMMFTALPENAQDAVNLADDMSSSLTQFSKYGITPLVIMEPTYNGGSQLADLSDITSQQSLSNLQTYFETLKENGIIDQQMGTWVPLPEPDIPEWSGGVTTPSLFTQNFIGISNVLRSVFPTANLSVMLDSTAYPSGDIAEDEGSTATADLLPYVTGLPKGLVDSFGFQGFPWTPTDTPNNYLNASVAIALAHALGVSQVWLNTGTASEYQDATTGAITNVSTDTRAQQLSGVLTQASAIISAGYQVSINIFAQAKLAQDGADWSYTSTPQQLAVLNDFINQASAQDIEISVFDSQ
jgi:glutaredoxin-related protein